MIKLAASAMLVTALVDVTIAFVWIGLIGVGEVRDTFNLTFPKKKVGDTDDGYKSSARKRN